MKLVLFSSSDFAQNEKLDRELFRLARTDKPTMVYVPDTLTEPKYYFESWKEHYSQLGVEKFIYFPLKKGSSKKLLKSVFESHIIYFSGGNTFTFLKNLKKSGLANRFKKFLANGGVLSGCSAGAIIMTNNIMTAKVPRLDADRNNARIRDLRGMNILGFEFSPHYQDRPTIRSELISYSKTIPRPVYGCQDGGGIVVSGSRLRFIGPVVEFSAGQIKTVRNRWVKMKQPFSQFIS